MGDRQPLLGGDRSPANQPLNEAPNSARGPSRGLEAFCGKLGMDVSTGKPVKNSPSTYRKFCSAYNWNMGKSIGAYGIAYTILILQLAIGVTISIVTALQPPKAHAVVIILGGVNSLIAGIGAIMQYTGEPMRSWRVFATLDKLDRDIADTMGDFRDPDFQGNGREEGENIAKAFDQAIGDALANEPQVWAPGNNAVGRVMRLGEASHINGDQDH